MRLFGLRVHVVILTFALLVGGVLGAGHWRYERQLRVPLEEALLEVPGVEAVEVESTGRLRTLAVTHLSVRLSPDADLERAYRQVEAVARASLGHQLGRIELVDAPDPVLEEAARQMRFAVEEALVTGAFRQMAEDIQRLAGAHGLDGSKVSMDRHFIYLSLRHGDAFLYQLVPREPGEAAPLRAREGV